METIHDGFCNSKLRSKKLIEESNKHLKDIEDTLKVSNHFHIDYNHDCYISGVLRASIKVIVHFFSQQSHGRKVCFNDCVNAEHEDITEMLL